MPEYLAPGLYIEEIERGPTPIEGVATSTVAFIGETAKGPVKPRFITSYNEYIRYFGDIYDSGKYLPYAVKAFFDNGGRRCYVARIVGANAIPSSVTIDGYSITATGPGTWGDRIYARLEPGTTRINGASIGFRLRLYYWDRTILEAPGFDDRGNVTRRPSPSLLEDFDDLSLDESHPNYWDKRVNNGNSALIELSIAPDAALPTGVTAPVPLAGGDNGDAIIASNFEGSRDTNPPTGLNALTLDSYRDIAIVHAPGQADQAITNAVITHCERNRFRFAVVDSAQNSADFASIDPRSERDTQFAAFYYPWIYISDPRTGARKKVPPGGFVCGIYARSDNTRGVFKAPANEVVAGALDLEFDIDQGKQENLNPKGVNCIRRFPGRGIRVWGARTLSSDPLWKYVSVRRLFIFIEASIYNSTQWVVFEPNDQRLWARVKQTVTLFLRTQWREGALFGAKEEEAFTVAVGRETMTEDDILNGRLIIEVGIAPVRPAEFVIFRVYQKTQEAKS